MQLNVPKTRPSHQMASPVRSVLSVHGMQCWSEVVTQLRTQCACVPEASICQSSATNVCHALNVRQDMVFGGSAVAIGTRNAVNVLPDPFPESFRIRWDACCVHHVTRHIRSCYKNALVPRIPFASVSLLPSEHIYCLFFVKSRDQMH